MSAETPGRPESAGPPPLIRILQDFTLEANRYVDSAGGRNDMHRTDLNALAVIMRHAARGETVTPGVLRKELNLSSPATTALIDRLHGSGHVVREREGPDRRQVQLRMTPKAYRDGGAMFLPLARHMGAAMAEFTPEEQEIVTRFMNSMIEATIRAAQEAAQAQPGTGGRLPK
ncbi:MarR family transcriptional regulator [Arthrobacter sp. PAMC25564]|uniref:MarR family winged helix-turn-helix transcriptional regulator n=1 Tax=Arthrobacter sp. PAMC25564 TaxID=2565366 RepID=UPI0010A2676A|nr:MarR family winged helix-turn-helix transcriptional regulator [Arthrobacter sp. PAMC25564]QCB96326.1 MarR family transcriptional regulator [Arthrobacter sp. PAMC25564]